MTGPKIGDRVRVEYDGVVSGTTMFEPGRIDVRIDGSDWVASVLPEHCTVIAPPVKVGDLLDESNIDRLPHASVVVAPGGLAAQVFVTGDSCEWRIPGDPGYMTHSAVLKWDATVVHIGSDS